MNRRIEGTIVTKFSLGIIDKPDVGGAFVPTDFSNLEFWFDASDAATITEISGEVSQWDDKGPNGYDLVQGTAARQPNTSTLLGESSIFFDSNDVLEALTLTLTLEPATMFAVVGATNVSADRYFLSIDNQDMYLRQSGTSIIALHAATSGSPNSLTASGVNAVNVPLAVVTRAQDSTTGDILTDDTTSAEDTDVGTLQSSFTDLRIGARGGSGTQGWLGHIHEVGLYSQRLSDADRTTLMDYLVSKWNL